jgi:hypothetical protein
MRSRTDDKHSSAWAATGRKTWYACEWRLALGRVAFQLMRVASGHRSNSIVDLLGAH